VPKKTKPVTSGENILMKWAFPIDLVRFRERGVRLQVGSALARRIDRAIARAVKKERDRCAYVVFVAKCNRENLEWVRDWIECPKCTENVLR